MFVILTEMSESEEEKELYNFTVVRFTHRGRRKAVEEIDIVNSDWLRLDAKRGTCLTKYIDCIDSQKDITLLHTLVKSLAPAPESWPNFPVEIVGRAGETSTKVIH